MQAITSPQTTSPVRMTWSERKGHCAARPNGLCKKVRIASSSAISLRLTQCHRPLLSSWTEPTIMLLLITWKRTSCRVGCKDHRPGATLPRSPFRQNLSAPLTSAIPLTLSLDQMGSRICKAAVGSVFITFADGSLRSVEKRMYTTKTCSLRRTPNSAPGTLSLSKHHCMRFKQPSVLPKHPLHLATRTLVPRRL